LIFKEAMSLLQECKQLDHSMSLLVSAGKMGHAEALFVAGSVLLHGPSAHAAEGSSCHELSASAVLNFELHSTNSRSSGGGSGGSGGNVRGQRFQRAYELLSRSASLGWGSALRKLAVMHASGVGSNVQTVQKLAKHAKHPHNSATAPSSPSSSPSLSTNAIGGDQHISLGLYHLAAIHGDTVSQLALAHRYNKGLGVRQDCETAAYFYSAVADKSHDEHHLGGLEQIHEHKLLTTAEEDDGTIDDGQKGDDDELIKYQIMRADEENHLPSIVAMGSLYYYGGHGLGRDQPRARQYFHRAANAMYSTPAESVQVGQGQVGYANMLLKGEGGEKNLTEAMKYYAKAADQHNNTRALNGLGYLYFHGNKVQGKQWCWCWCWCYGGWFVVVLVSLFSFCLLCCVVVFFVFGTGWQCHAKHNQSV
jgi:TPR repeat protein